MKENEEFQYIRMCSYSWWLKKDTKEIIASYMTGDYDKSIPVPPKNKIISVDLEALEEATSDGIQCFIKIKDNERKLRIDFSELDFLNKLKNIADRQDLNTIMRACKDLNIFK